MPEFKFKEIDTSRLDVCIQNPNRNVVRMLLKTIAYEKQDELLPDKWEIEHIFHKSGKPIILLIIRRPQLKEKIEHIGNKLPFEKNSIL